MSENADLDALNEWTRLGQQTKVPEAQSIVPDPELQRKATKPVRPKAPRKKVAETLCEDEKLKRKKTDPKPDPKPPLKKDPSPDPKPTPKTEPKPDLKSKPKPQVEPQMETKEESDDDSEMSDQVICTPPPTPLISIYLCNHHHH
ncbi:MAG: hypothetical protein GY737_14485 [Desulfobacteraceae bacterium]|nr:hypothetical protein [Desulfobacteraceae bacterium]